MVWVAVRTAAVLTLLAGAFALLPDASAYDVSALTIPGVVWGPISAVLHLGRLLPIATLVALAGIEVGWRAAMAGLWVTSWIMSHVFGR